MKCDISDTFENYHKRAHKAPPNFAKRHIENADYQKQSSSLC